MYKQYKIVHGKNDTQCPIICSWSIHSANYFFLEIWFTY